MKYWDTSAIVPLFMTEAASSVLREVLKADREIVCWWGTRIECVSALFRMSREGRLRTTDLAATRLRLTGLAADWSEIQPDDLLRTAAERVVGVHSLRAADALQLAAALVACDGAPDTLPFVCLDTRLREAALREGFAVLPDAVPRATAVRERRPRRSKVRA